MTSGYSNIKTQSSNIRDLSKFTREVTPPLTPPTPLASHQQQSHGGSMDDYMIEESNACGYLSTQFNMSEISSQYDHYESANSVSYPGVVSYNDVLHNNVQTSLQYHRSLQSQQENNHQSYHQHTHHQLMQQQEWFAQQGAQGFETSNNNGIQHGSTNLMAPSYESNSSYAHFSCANGIANSNSRERNNCNLSTSMNAQMRRELRLPTFKVRTLLNFLKFWKNVQVEASGHELGFD